MQRRPRSGSWDALGAVVRGLSEGLLYSVIGSVTYHHTGEAALIMDMNRDSGNRSRVGGRYNSLGLVNTPRAEPQ